MAIKDRVVELVLRAKNLLSEGTDEAAKSVDKLTKTSADLRNELRDLEDQRKLVTEFERTSKSVERTGTAYQRAQLRLDKLTQRLGDTSNLTGAQAKEFELASKAVESAEKAYKDAERTLADLSGEAKRTGTDVENLTATKRENERQTTATKRALEDYSEEVEQTDGALKRLDSGLKSGIARFAAWGAAAATAVAGLATAAVIRFSKESAALADDLNNASIQLGISTTRLQEFAAASRTVGVEQDQLVGLLRDVTKNIGEATRGSGEFAPLLDRIGLSIKDLVGLAPDEQILKIADAISGLGSEEQVSILEKLGSGASALLPILRDNASELERVAQAARDRGAIIEEDEIRRLVETQDALNRIRERLEGLRNRIVAALGPAFQGLARELDAAFDNRLVDGFVRSIEFLARITIRFITDTLQNLPEIRRQLQSVVDTLEFLGNTAKGVFSAIGTGIAAIVTAGSAQVTALSKLIELVVRGLNAIGLASDDAVRRAEERTANLVQTTIDLGNRTADWARSAQQAGIAAVTAFDNSGSAAERAASQTQGLESQYQALRDRANEVKESLLEIGGAGDAAAQATQSFAVRQSELRQEIEALVPQIKAAQNELGRDVTTENQRRLTELIRTYDDLVKKLNELERLSGKVPTVFKSADDVLGGTKNKIDDLVDSTEKFRQKVVVVGDDIRKVGADAESTADQVGGGISSIVAGWVGNLQLLSRAAAAAFRSRQGLPELASDVSELQARLEAVNFQLAESQRRLNNVGVSGVIKRLAQDAFQVEQAFLKQAIAATEFANKVNAGRASTAQLAMSAEDVARRFNLLDANQLSPLISAIQTARRQVDGLSQSLADTVANLRQELAGLQGDQEQVERLRFGQRELDLQQRLNQARAAGDKEAIRNAEEALKLNEQAFQLRLEQTRRATEEERVRSAQLAAEQARQSQDRETQQNQDRQAQERLVTERTPQQNVVPFTGPTQIVQVNLAVNGVPAATLSGPRNEVETLLRELERAQRLTT